MMCVVIPGQPVGKGRPRFGNGRVYTPEATSSWEDHAIMRIRMAKPEPIKIGPVRVDIEAETKRPQRLLGPSSSALRIWRDTKPDADNVAKAVLDAMTAAGVIKDDKQVADLRVRSFYVGKHDTPHVRVRWEGITDSNLSDVG